MSGPSFRPRAAVEALPTYKPGRSAAAVAAEHGLTEAIKLTSNELPYGPLPSVTEAMAEAVTDCRRYPDMGAAPIRQALCEALAIDPAMLTVGCGSSGILQQLALAFCEAGDEILYPWRSFEAYPIMAIQTGATPVTVPLKRQAFDLDAVADAISDRTRLVFLANPNNPTGTAFSKAQFDAFLARVPDRVLVVLDEAYTEFTTRGDLPRGLEYATTRPNVVASRTFSKAYGLAGLRLGYAVGDPMVIAALDKVRIPFSVSTVAQAAGVASVAAADELAERVDEVVAERSRVEAALREMGVAVPDPQGNFVWLPAGAATDRVAKALESHGIGGRAFSGEGVRLTIGDRSENDALLAALADVVGDNGAAVADDWLLPTGDLARAQGQWLARLDTVANRLADQAGDRRQGLTRPDEGGTEQWNENQVWAHIGEIGWYWQKQLEHIIDTAAADDYNGEPVPFGRIKSNEARIAAIAEGQHQPIADHLESVLAFCDVHRSYLSGLSAADWSRVGRHQTLGDMDMDHMQNHFLIGHLEEHADQLDELTPEDDE